MVLKTFLGAILFLAILLLIIPDEAKNHVFGLLITRAAEAIFSTGGWVAAGDVDDDLDVVDGGCTRLVRYGENRL